MSTETPLKFHPFLMLRTPYFSYQDFDVAKTNELLKDSIFQTAIYLASPAFYHALKTANFNWELLTEKAKLSLHKYHNRICFRPTPFALFATFGQLPWEENESFPPTHIINEKVHLHFDHQINCAFAERLKTTVKDEMLWLNPSLHLVDQQFRYVKTIKKTGGKFDFQLAAMAADFILKAIVKKARKSGIGLSVLTDIITKWAQCSEAEAKAYAQFLKDEEILISAISPTLVGSPFLKHLLEQPLLQQTDYVQKVKKLVNGLNIDLPCTASVFEQHFKAIKQILREEDLAELKNPYYCSLERRYNGGIPVKHQESILKAVALLHQLSPATDAPNLTKFIQHFTKRYEQQKVSLLKVLDPEVGLGYGQQEQLVKESLLQDLPFESSQNNNSIIWDEAKQLLLKKWLISDDHKTARIDLDTSDLAQLGSKNKSQLPPSLSVMFRILDEQLFIETAGGASANALTGRFTFFSNDILETCKAIVAEEQAQQPAVIFADIVQHSAYHTDNINLRQSIYDYEIPVNGVSRLPVKQQIPLADLTLKVVGNEMILESIRLGRRVIPRLSTAFNPQWNELSAFRLLYDLQAQNIQSNLTLSLEQAFPGLDFYPRVNFGNTVLCLAKWELKEQDIQALNQTVAEKAKAALSHLREKRHLPNVIAITRHDHQLVFDLNKDEDADLFRTCLQGLKRIWLVEYPFTKAANKTIIDRTGKAYQGQFIAHLINKEKIYATGSKLKNAQTAPQRTFIPGDEWFYIKLYCSPAFANKLLGGEIARLIGKLAKQNKNIIWFFIRYYDSEPHLRLRINKTGLENIDLSKTFFSALRSLEKKGFIHHIQTDSYVRELERYQIYGMDAVEHLFYQSSKLILELLKRQQKFPELFSEHHFALYSVNGMIDTFLPTPDLKLDFLEQMSSKFYSEFSSDKSLKLALDKKYRAMKGEINEVLENKNYLKEGRLTKPFRELISALNNHYTNSKHRSEQQRITLLADLVHMHLNRLFQEDQRQQEMVVYHLLAKYQKGIVARNKVSLIPTF